MSSIFLNLAPQLGGTRFGPFEGPYVGIGSDPEQCQVVLPAEYGVYPVHIWLTPGNAGWVIQMAVQGASTFLTTSNYESLPLQEAVELHDGDSFAVGAPHGPAFTIETATSKKKSAANRIRLGGRQRPTANGIGNEVMRQISTKAMTNGTFAQFSQLFFRARSGAMFQPRYIVGALIGLGGTVCAGCAGLGTWLLNQ